jgi:hypothetical protein
LLGKSLGIPTIPAGGRRLRAASVALAVISATTLSLWPGGATAHDHRIPRAKLVSKKAWQRGRLQSFCWVTGRVNTNTACAGGAHSWPPRDRTPGGRRAIVRINKVQRPRKLKLTRWRRIDDQQAPIGDGREVNYHLETTVHRGRIVQEARFHLPGKRGHYYLRAFGVWRDTVSGDRQNATWHFHLKLR